MTQPDHLGRLSEHPMPMLHTRPIRPRVLARGALALPVLLAVCGPDALDPAETGGRLLPGTGNLAYSSGHPMSISPDHRWLLFAREATEEPASSDAAPHSIEPLGAYVLYDLSTERGIGIAVSEEVAELVASGRSMVLPDGGCWQETGSGLRVLLRGSVGTAFAVDPLDDAPTWQVIEVDRETMQDACPISGASRRPVNRVGRFEIEGRDTRSVQIRSATNPATIFARHSSAPISTGLQVDHVRLSPDGRRLAYSINNALGSFVSNSVLFVVAGDASSGSAASLASPVYAVDWAPDGSTLYAVVRVERTLAIYRWTMASLGER